MPRPRLNDNPPAEARDEVSALARGLAILRLVSQSPQPLSNRELAEATGIPKATVSRLAATLVSSGFLRQLPDSERFGLSSGLLEMGNAYLRNFDLRAHARPHLAALAEFAGAAVHMGVRNGLDMVLIEHIRPYSAVIVSSLDVGAHIDLASSASGRAWLAAMEAPERQALLDKLREASGSKWRSVKARLDAALEEHAEHGYCSSLGDWHTEIHALGVAVRGPRGDLYAISCGGPAYLLPRERLIGKIAPRLLETARAIAAEAGAA